MLIFAGGKLDFLCRPVSLILALPTRIPTLKVTARLVLRHSGMSALTPKADIRGSGWNTGTARRKFSKF
jgi:hypothetical protein